MQDKKSSLESMYPELVKEWNDRNAKSPSEYTFGSGEKVWWKCTKCGYEWQARICERTRKDRPSGCPACAGKIVLPTRNLLVEAPQIAREWSDKNDLRPNEVTTHSNKKVWWKCNVCGFEWQAPIYSRATGCGCPRCAGRVPTVGVDDLATMSPELLQEWDYDYNDDPTHYTPMSGQKVRWICPVCGYSWKATIASRVRGSGCPYCSGHKATKGKNDLATLFPNLLAEWDPENILMPEYVSAYSHKLAIWNCPKCGNRYLAKISDRTKLLTGCPACSGKSL